MKANVSAVTSRKARADLDVCSMSTASVTAYAGRLSVQGLRGHHPRGWVFRAAVSSVHAVKRQAAMVNIKTSAVKEQPACLVKGHAILQRQCPSGNPGP